MAFSQCRPYVIHHLNFTLNAQRVSVGSYYLKIIRMHTNFN